MEFLSPLRYPGGKAKVSDFVQCLIKENTLLDGVYVEPYVGGGSVALSLLFNEYVKDIYINDKDISIYAFWHSVLYESDALCKLIKETPVTVETWYKLRDYQADKSNIDLLNLGFSTFFLNRTNRSGILKAGIIGGYAQTGNYKIDARFNKDELIKRIQRIADYADRIHLTNEDAVSLVQRLKLILPPNTLVYLDPPYYIKGKGLYMNYYNDQDHQDIANAGQQHIQNGSSSPYPACSSPRTRISLSWYNSDCLLSFRRISSLLTGSFISFLRLMLKSRKS